MNKNPKSDLRNLCIGLGILLTILGSYIAFAAPYDMHSSFSYTDPFTGQPKTTYTTVTTYGNPMGFYIDGLGFILILIGFYMHTDYSTNQKRTFKGKVCGDCHFFGKEHCVREEKLYNAMPCEDFTP